jgi:hypothetical protein
MMKRILLVAVIGLVAVFAFAGIYDAMKSRPSAASSQATGGLLGQEPGPAPRPPPPGGPAVEIRTDEPPEEQEIKVGEVHVLTEDRHATVMNPEAVGDGVWTFPPGSTCFAESDGRLTVVAVGGERILLRYARPPQAEVIDQKVRVELAIRQEEAGQGQKACPDGTMFFIGHDEYGGIVGEDVTGSDLEAAKRLLAPPEPRRADKRRKK